MSDSGIPEDIRQFIFAYIDSVEQLEVLFLLRQSEGKPFTAQQISAEIRTSLGSAQNRLSTLERSGLLERNGDAFRYALAQSELDVVIGRLAQEYRLRRHKILEQIFSPMKRAKQFADAFLVGGPKKKEDENG